MNQHFKSYLNSFKVKKRFWISFLIDLGFIGSFFFIVTALGTILNQKAFELSQGKSTEQIQQMLLSMQADKAVTFLTNLKSFAIFLTITLLVLFVGGLLFYSLSRRLNWGYLVHKKFSVKKYWKWNLLNIVILAPMLLYGILYFIFGGVTGFFVSLIKNQTIIIYYQSLVDLFFFVGFLLLLFLIYYSFIKTNKIWHSFGNAFDLIKHHWKKMWPMFLFCCLNSIIISLIIHSFNKFMYPSFLLIMINLIGFFLFLSWMRVYVLKTIN